MSSQLKSGDVITRAGIAGMLCAYRDAIMRTTQAQIAQHILPRSDFDEIIKKEQEIKERFIESIMEELQENKHG